MGSKLLLACEGLRIELDYLKKKQQLNREIIYLPQGLHNEPEKMRLEVAAKIAEIEDRRPEVDTILLGYGLCGRGMCGVTSRHATLVIPRVHDCIPLFAGIPQKELGLTEKNSGVLWLSAGMMEYGSLARHLVEKRHTEYVEKFGEKRAARMIKAENSVFSNYKGVWYVGWSGLGNKYADLAKAVAKELSLPYFEVEGKQTYLGDLLEGKHDEERFLYLEPGFTIDMDSESNIVAKKN